MIEYLKQDKQLKHKLKLIVNSNEQLKKTYEKSKKDRRIKEKNYNDEKDKIINLFCSFIIKGDVSISFSNRNISNSRRSLSR